MVAATRKDFVARSGGIGLAGSVWMPDATPGYSVLMYPGSGATDRDNGSYFVPIRSHLLAHGCAVCSFDKRGVGESSGRWQEADITEQAQDVLAVLDTVTAQGLLHGPIGLFGHSQGGWVVIEAARTQPSLSFVVTNSGPGVTPAAQMRYAASRDMTAAQGPTAELAEMLRVFDIGAALMREGLPFDLALSRLEAEVGPVSGPGAVRRFLPADPDEWRFASSILDYDPRSAMTAIEVPLLAVFGADDMVVPVDPSIEAFRESVRKDLLHVQVFPGADHRIQVCDDASFADGYFDTLSAFIETALDGLPKS